jgi:hypothetical protein
MATKNLTYAEDKAVVAKVKAEALQQIAGKIDQIKDLYSECASLARETEVDFQFYLGENDDSVSFTGDPSNQWQNSGC